MKPIIDHDDGTRTCTACDERKPLDEFDFDKRGRAGRRGQCKLCRSAFMKAWYAANRERHRAKQYARFKANNELVKARDRERYQKDPVKKREAALRWARENPEKSRALGGRRRARKLQAPTIPFTSAQLEQRLAFYGHRCWLCLGPSEHVDHVKPLAAGGWHCLANLRPICRSCNSSKGARWPFPVSRGAFAA